MNCETMTTRPLFFLFVAASVAACASETSGTVRPKVRGTTTASASEGQLLTTSTGTWKGTPAISYAYAWQRCSAGTCSTITGENPARVASSAACCSGVGVSFTCAISFIYYEVYHNCERVQALG